MIKRIRVKGAWQLRRMLWVVVAGYRYFISPLLGRHCRFEPSCSVYAQQAILEHGVFTGGYLTVKRLCRCHPWGGCGYDPVPPVGQ